jgi:hypothetical protein
MGAVGCSRYEEGNLINSQLKGIMQKQKQQIHNGNETTQIVVNLMETLFSFFLEGGMF